MRMAPRQFEHPRAGGPGFTLLEILLVVAVMAVVSAGVAFSLISVDAQSRLRRAGEDLEIWLSSICTQAAMTQRPHRIELRPGHSVVGVQALSGGGSAAELEHELPRQVAIDAVRLEQQTLTQKPVQLLVQPSGYLRAFSVRLACGEARQWVRWDPVEGRLHEEEML